ncbi:hypothetical protein JRQ81_010314 [Phrynocephalus forsythii]|uniref:Uncharacterized protein n=1 Tax=Phrynocephalus forsythii TaxID=171643 RepID=A0A9Q0X8W3_9SAUR|nr:hypothetical protein JRQ81_010314 [Phrynocephalus forsythii]
MWLYARLWYQSIASIQQCEYLEGESHKTQLKKQLESAELKNQRLKEVFQAKIQEFRKVCYKLTGYQIDMTTENQYRLTSIYAEHQEDCLIFKACSWFAETSAVQDCALAQPEFRINSLD